MSEKINWSLYSKLMESGFDFLFVKYLKDGSFEVVDSKTIQEKDIIYICQKENNGKDLFRKEMMDSLFDDFCSNYIHRNSDFRADWVYDESFSFSHDIFYKKIGEFLDSIKINHMYRTFCAFGSISIHDVLAIQEYERVRSLEKRDQA